MTLPLKKLVWCSIVIRKRLPMGMIQWIKMPALKLLLWCIIFYILLQPLLRKITHRNPLLYPRCSMVLLHLPTKLGHFWVQGFFRLGFIFHGAYGYYMPWPEIPWTPSSASRNGPSAAWFLDHQRNVNPQAPCGPRGPGQLWSRRALHLLHVP